MEMILYFEKKSYFILKVSCRNTVLIIIIVIFQATYVEVVDARIVPSFRTKNMSSLATTMHIKMQVQMKIKMSLLF